MCADVSYTLVAFIFSCVYLRIYLATGRHVCEYFRSNIFIVVSRKDELKDYDCLVVFVLTHGEEGEIIYAKDVKYYVKELVEPFTGTNCLNLANKPKLFFIQVSGILVIVTKLRVME
jgi:hypothetical protein